MKKKNLYKSFNFKYFKLNTTIKILKIVFKYRKKNSIKFILLMIFYLLQLLGQIFIDLFKRQYKLINKFKELKIKAMIQNKN